MMIFVWAVVSSPLFIAGALWEHNHVASIAMLVAGFFIQAWAGNVMEK